MTEKLYPSTTHPSSNMDSIGLIQTSFFLYSTELYTDKATICLFDGAGQDNDRFTHFGDLWRLDP
jgi:hypothetical protein